MQDTKIITKISTQDALELGRREGLKEAYREMKDVLDADPDFIKAFVRARLKTLNELNAQRLL